MGNENKKCCASVNERTMRKMHKAAIEWAENSLEHLQKSINSYETVLAKVKGDISDYKRQIQEINQKIEDLRKLEDFISERMSEDKLVLVSENEMYNRIKSLPIESERFDLKKAENWKHKYEGKYFHLNADGNGDTYAYVEKVANADSEKEPGVILFSGIVYRFIKTENTSRSSVSRGNNLQFNRLWNECTKDEFDNGVNNGIG